jgi:hypothetical protein
MFTCGPAMFAAAGTVLAPSDNAYYVDVTIPSGKVASDQTNFPVMVDLANLPSGFWSHVSSSGSEIRCKTTAGVSLAFDVARFDKANSAGWMFVKVPTLAAASSNVIRIYYGASSLAALAASDTYGRNAVWSDYHRVTIFSEPGVDRTGASYGAYSFMQPGKTFAATTVKSSFGFSVEAQGVEWDGTNYYVTDTGSLYKYDSSWTLVTSVANLYTSAAGTDHLGDPCMVGSELWIPADNWPEANTERIIRVRPSDLAVLGVITPSGVEAAGRSISGLAYNSADGYVWATDYNNGANIMRLSASTGALVDTISLKQSLTTIQGITFLGDYVYLVTGSGRIWELTRTGELRRLTYNPSANIGEGLCTNGSNIIYINGSGTSSASSLAWTADPTGAATDWLNLAAPSGIVQMAPFTGLTKFTQWSMGAHILLVNKPSSRGVLSYYDATGSSNTTRETLGYHSATDRWGLWNSTDGWLDATAAGSPALNTVYRLNATHDGTTVRKAYVNGAAFTDNTVAQRPSGVGDALFVGASDSAGNEELAGRVNFAYLRSGVLTDNWIAAESSNWLTPSGFYTVGTEQAA